jgi:hypothetical protein
MRLLSTLALGFSLLACAPSYFVPVPESPPGAADEATLQVLAREAVSPNPERANQAISRLRASGPAGLNALLAEYRDELAQLDGRSAPRPALRRALEQVAKQRDAHAARLYWYTSLEEAQRAARATGKPILSLRLLGNLDEELSCANSRFFRTALYANERVGEVLRQDFVLHWSAERPAPKITIDFGDGRKLETTITGNSIHYVLDAEGRPVDALPGLYGPQAFRRGIERAGKAARESARLEGLEQRQFVSEYHTAALRDLMDTWEGSLRNVGALAAGPPSPWGPGPNPSAANAAPTAVSKAKVEAPLVQAVQRAIDELPTPVEPNAWARLITAAAGDAKLDAASLALMRVKLGAGIDDKSFARRAQSFELSIAEDTIRNENTYHRVIHEWFSAGGAPDAIAALNRRVYDELFLTPRADPWLGLLPVDGYAAVERQGITAPAKAVPKARHARR